MISFSDLNDETVHYVVHLHGTHTYTVVDGGSKKGSRKLASSEGYAFVLKRTLVSGVTEWRCSVRGKGTGCPAVIKQTGYAFVKGSRGHSHPANPGLLTAVQNAKEVIIFNLSVIKCPNIFILLAQRRKYTGLKTNRTLYYYVFRL
ncbi:hypothetical protein DPMN_159996 [Dreissena polymorpha]|uniref:FLYWCH-type domain-containing protein n=1 Tax=Dreissena polymorpha TaxID=45954 RepID=A0A9D4EQ92_DREPO|nr:hypothetical protein DPMN_159996 [Dreissena polymorpha]